MIFVTLAVTLSAQSYWTKTKPELFAHLKAESPEAVVYYDDDGDIVQMLFGITQVFVFYDKPLPTQMILVPHTPSAKANTSEAFHEAFAYYSTWKGNPVYVSMKSDEIHCVVEQDGDETRYIFMRVKL